MLRGPISLIQSLAVMGTTSKWLVHDDQKDLFEILVALALNVLISLPLALAAFLVFSVWPASGRAIYGWFFRLF